MTASGEQKHNASVLALDSFVIAPSTFKLVMYKSRDSALYLVGWSTLIGSAKDRIG